MSYDPKKTYHWQREDQFVLSGQEFGLVLNTLRAFLATEESARVLLAQQTLNHLDAILAKAVEEGIAKEQEPVEPPQNM